MEVTLLPQVVAQVWYLQLLVHRCFTLVVGVLVFIEVYLALLLQVRAEQVVAVLEALL